MKEKMKNFLAECGIAHKNNNILNQNDTVNSKTPTYLDTFGVKLILIDIDNDKQEPIYYS